MGKMTALSDSRREGEGCGGGARMAALDRTDFLR